MPRWLIILNNTVPKYLICLIVFFWRVGVKRMGPDSFQWCPATGQGATGTDWSRGSSIWTGGRIFSLWGWRSTGTGCPGRLWNLLLWRNSRPAWTRSCAVCCRWPCFGRAGGVGLDDPQRSLPTPIILWFCDSVILLVVRPLTWSSKCFYAFRTWGSEVTPILLVALASQELKSYFISVGLY